MTKEAGHNRWLIVLTIMLGTTMSSIDMTIVNVALPYMRGNLGASVEEITWVATGYILSNVMIMPIVSMLSSRFGRKRFFAFSIAVFTITSMFCGMARDLTSITLFRVLQGLGGGALVPISMAILRETFPPEEQGIAMGIFGFGALLGPAFGPTIGGWLTDNYSWPWIFYVNVPLGILNLMMVVRFIHDPPYLVRNKDKIDFSGLIFMAVGLGALQLMLEKGQQKNWFESDMIKYLAAMSLVGLLLFVWRELTADKPAVNLRTLKDLNFASGTLLVGILGMGLNASLFLLPMLLQQILGYPAQDAGLTLMPRTIAMAMGMLLMGRFYNMIGPRILIGSGLSVCALSFYQLSMMNLNVGFWNIFFPQFLQGIGFAMIFVALSTTALSSIEKQKMTDATGLYNVVRQVFGSMGISVAATQLSKWITYNRALLVENVTSFRDASSNWHSALSSALMQLGTDQLNAQGIALRSLDGMVMRQATMLAYNHLHLLIAFLFIVSIPLVFLLKKRAA